MLNEDLERLALGTIEYKVKPYAPADVLGRASALVSRGHRSEPGIQRLADLVVDWECGKEFRRGVDLQLGATLFELLDVLRLVNAQKTTPLSMAF